MSDHPRRRDIDRRQKAARDGWNNPTRRMVSDTEVALLLYKANRSRISDANKLFAATMHAIEDMRTIMFWMTDETAATSFAIVCDALRREPHQVATALFKDTDTNLLNIILGRPYRCPVCLQSKGYLQCPPKPTS